MGDVIAQAFAGDQVSGLQRVRDRSKRATIGSPVTK
jgi:hypothetical protein